MNILNLHVDHWSMLDTSNSSDCSEITYNTTDITTLIEDISITNIDDICDLNNKEYTH
jgi:hypothetical protein